MLNRKLIPISASIFMFLGCMIASEIASSLPSQCTSPRTWIRRLPKQSCQLPEKQRACYADCTDIHHDWMKKCDAGNIRNFDACAQVACTALKSCFANCAAPKKDCYTLPDFSKGI